LLKNFTHICRRGTVVVVVLVIVIVELVLVVVKVKVKQSHYRPGVAQRVPGS
jgi:hypothetical protein